MANRRKLLAELLVSVAGVMIFLSVNKWIDLNGWGGLSSIIALAGAFILIFSEKILSYLPHTFLNKIIFITLGHTLIFLGIKDVLGKYIDQWFIAFLIIGMVLITYSNEIAGYFTNDK